MTTKIEVLRSRIVEAQTKGKDVSVLEKQLKEARLDEQTKAEVAELKKVADQRVEWQREADKIQEKVRLQGEAIDRFLALRDDLMGKPIEELLAQAQELIKAQNDCYEQYHDTFMFGAHVKIIPKGYLPEGFSCPRLEMSGGLVPADDKAAEGIWYLRSGLGCLGLIVKGSMVTFQREVDDGVGHDTENEPTEIELSCRVCSHEKAAEINKALQDGRSLRAIEDEFNVSRSTLSRHKNNCLNLGVIRIVEASEG